MYVPTRPNYCSLVWSDRLGTVWWQSGRGRWAQGPLRYHILCPNGGGGGAASAPPRWATLLHRVTAAAGGWRVAAAAAAAAAAGWQLPAAAMVAI